MILKASAASENGEDDISRRMSCAGSPGAKAVPAIVNVDKARSAPILKDTALAS